MIFLKNAFTAHLKTCPCPILFFESCPCPCPCPLPDSLLLNRARAPARFFSPNRARAEVGHDEEVGQGQGHGRGHDEEVGQGQGHGRGHDEEVGQGQGHGRGHDEEVGQGQGHGRGHDEEVGQGHGRGHDEEVGQGTAQQNAIWRFAALFLAQEILQQIAKMLFVVRFYPFSMV